jgi:hypothetical protein
MFAAAERRKIYIPCNIQFSLQDAAGFLLTNL